MLPHFTFHRVVSLIVIYGREKKLENPPGEAHKNITLNGVDDIFRSKVFADIYFQSLFILKLESSLRIKSKKATFRMMQNDKNDAKFHKV